MLRVGSCLILVALLCSSPLLAQEGRLEQVRQDVNQSGSSQSSSGCANDDSDNIGNALVAYAVCLPFVLPRACLEDDGSSADFPRYPYSSSYSGYLWLQEKTDPLPDGESPGLKWWGIHLAFEDGNDFRSLNREGIRVAVDTSSRFGLRTRWDFFQESLSNHLADHTVLGNFDFTYRFAQNENAEFYAGLGARMMTDSTQTRFGFNFTYGADVFPVKPLVVSTSLDVGTLGSAVVFEARATLGAVFRSAEVFAGYDFLRIGSVNLQGPLLGLRLWF